MNFSRKENLKILSSAPLIDSHQTGCIPAHFLSLSFYKYELPWQCTDPPSDYDDYEMGIMG